MFSLDPRIVLFASLTLFTAIHGQEDSSCRQKFVKREIYSSLHDAIVEYGIDNPEQQHVNLLPLGLPLDFEDFNPGKKSRFTTSETLPLKVVENALPLVDKIFPAGATVKPAPNISKSDKDFESLSYTFDYILNNMIVLPRNFSSQEKLRAKYYLQELVPNPELAIQNKSTLPRFLLYDYYRTLYLEKKEDKETQMDSHRAALTQQEYENWGVKELPTLQSNTTAAFQKWMIFGYKSEVEKELQYFDIDSHEDTLMSTRALFKSMAVYSERDPHVQIYPFTFEPEDWYQVLNSREPQSSAQLRYQQSLLKAQQALMNAARNDLANKTSDDVNISLGKIKDIMESLNRRVKNAIDKLLQMEVECFAKVNLTVCGDIIHTHTAFKLLLDDVAEHYEQAAYLESILNGRVEAISVLQKKLSEVAGRLKNLNKQISAADDKETSDIIDLTVGMHTDFLSNTTCLEAGKIQFSFHTPLFDKSVCSASTEAESKQYCSDVRVPLNATQSSLWSVHSCAIDDDLKAFDNVLSNFHTEMNTRDTEITASLQRVDIKRSWFDLNIFSDSKHYTMKRNRGLVSPGRIALQNYFHQIAESGQYLMPQFTSSLVLASNISLFFPGLGSWRDELTDIDNHTNGIINMLMKYAYAPTLEGGYGPFSFAPSRGVRKDTHNFRVERSNGGVLIRVPGAQVIGFVSTVIPRFPEIQRDTPKPVECVMQPSSNIHQRRRRSALDGNTSSESFSVRELSNTLFSKGIDEHYTRENKLITDQEREHHTPSKSLDDLLQRADMTGEKISKLLEKIKQEQGNELVSTPVSVPLGERKDFNLGNTA